VCDWTRARGREKFAFPRLSTATDEKKSHTRRVGLIYELTHNIVIMIINNNNNNNDRRPTMGVAMLVDWRFFSAASSAGRRRRYAPVGGPSRFVPAHGN